MNFVENYGSVFVHHVNCILDSRLLLDEDMQLLLSFWNPQFIAKKRIFNSTSIISTSCVTLGTITSIKLRNVYAFTVLATPAVVQLYRYIKVGFFKRKYKRNFEKCLTLILELYELNRSIIEYYSKRGVQVSSFNPNEEFLNRLINLEIEILEQLRIKMLRICELVLISETQYICSFEWNLKDLRIFENDSKTMKQQFEKINNMYILMISNFLSCIGLSLCVQLWRENANDVRGIFNVVIPEIVNFIEGSLKEMKLRFNRARFTLSNVGRPKNLNKNRLPFQKFLSDFITNMQTTFEMAKHLQLLVDDEDFSKKHQEAADVIDNINHGIFSCNESLNMLERGFILCTKRLPSKKLDAVVEVIPTNEEPPTTISIRYDDPLLNLEEEEYNLSIHGSEDDVLETLRNYTDECSTEHLELLLDELKRKLEERKPKQKQNIENEIKLQPPPLPPPPSVNPREIPNTSETLSLLTHDGNFLNTLKDVVKKLNREEEFQFGFNMFPEIPRPFNTTYRCFSVAMLPGNERQDVERGGKIIMPPSALEQLTRLNINYPMLFKIVNKNTNRTTHCGVLEFVADEGKVYLPLWMMHNLVLEEGDLIQIESVSLPVGKFAKFQPLSPDFLDITNPKAVLENCLRTFACLTTEDVIAVKYNQRVYELCVLETQPGNAISIIECDMNVEFAPPVGYKESQEVNNVEEEMIIDPADLMPEPAGFVAFRGTGNRLDGKRRKDSGSTDVSTPKPVYVRGIPDYDYEIGTLNFLRHFTKSPVSSKEQNGEFKAFSGEGFSLKRRN